MPAALAPYGLLPVGLIGGQVFAGSTRQIAIGTGMATAIGYGDVVKLVAGLIQRDVATSTATPVGVFLGCTYTDPTFGKVFRQFYPAATAASDITAYVADDPDTLFKVAITSTTTSTIGAVTRAVLGQNAVLTQTALNTTTGNSYVSAGQTTATTATWPLRIVDMVVGSENASGSFTEVLVKWNAPSVASLVGGHVYNQPFGTA